MPPLSPERRRQILDLAAQGLVDKEIAHRLGVGHRTVRGHLERIDRESGVANRTEAVAAWVWLGAVRDASRPLTGVTPSNASI